MRKPRLIFHLLVTLGSLSMAGCGLLMFGTVTTVGVTAMTVKAGADLATGTVRMTGDAAQSTVRVGKSSIATAVNGDRVTTTYPVRLSRAFFAALDTMREMKFETVKDDYDASSGIIQAQTRDNTLIDVQFKAVDNSHTEISIRVGVQGNTTVSMLIHDRIAQKLSEETPQYTVGSPGDQK